MEDLAMTKINVLGGYVSLGGEVLPAPNAIKADQDLILEMYQNEKQMISITFENRDKAIDALCQKVFGAAPAYQEKEQPQLRYDPRLDGQDIPQEVYEAAALVSDYFTTRFGHSDWQFMGLQPRK